MIEKKASLTAWIEKKKTSASRLELAERLLTSQNGLDRLAGELRAAIFWAVEGWLRQKNIAPDFGNGWHSMMDQYIEIEGLENVLCDTTCFTLHSVVLLEREFCADFSAANTAAQLDVEKWLSKAKGCLLCVRNIINDMENELSAHAAT